MRRRPTEAARQPRGAPDRSGCPVTRDVQRKHVVAVQFACHAWPKESGERTVPVAPDAPVGPVAPVSEKPAAPVAPEAPAAPAAPARSAHVCAQWSGKLARHMACSAHLDSGTPAPPLHIVHRRHAWWREHALGSMTSTHPRPHWQPGVMHSAPLDKRCSRAVARRRCRWACWRPTHNHLNTQSQSLAQAHTLTSQEPSTTDQVAKGQSCLGSVLLGIEPRMHWGETGMAGAHPRRPQRPRCPGAQSAQSGRSPRRRSPPPCPSRPALSGPWLRPAGSECTCARACGTCLLRCCSARLRHG